jgi:hypothetical protein
MEHSTAQRRLVKSPPELWAQVSSEDVLARHLAGFGEIRITRVDPETTVAWEGDRASGTVELAPAGWGTKVVLTATTAPPAAPAVTAAAMPEAPEPKPEPAAEPPAPAPRRGFLARLLGRGAPTGEIPAPGPPMPDPSPPTPTPDPMPPAPDPMPPDPTPGPGPAPPIDPTPPAPGPGPMPPSIELDPSRTVAILTEVLDDLGGVRPRALSRD